MRSNVFLRMIIILLIYFGLRYFGGNIGKQILYPIQLLVTFLHEFGHAVGAIISGGEVDRIQINKDGSGFTGTIGGSRPIILMGGYLGSAIFGNILFYIGAKSKLWVKPFLILVGLSMLYTGFVWHNSAFTTGILALFAVILFFIAFKTSLGKEVLMFLGLVCIIYIIQDFNIGPSSDLEKYAEYMKVLPQGVWMYIWLLLVLLLFFLNMRLLFRNDKKDNFPVKSEEDDFLTI